MALSGCPQFAVDDGAQAGEQAFRIEAGKAGETVDGDGELHR
jgi:hypothetical protein